MPFDVTINILEHDESFLTGTEGGRWRLTRQLASGGAVTTQFLDATDLIGVWAALPADLYDFSLVKMNLAETDTLGPLITKRQAVGPDTPPPPASDVTPPTATWQNPEQGEIVAGLVEFHVTAEDDNGVALTELTIDGVPHDLGAVWDTTGIANDTVVSLALHVVDTATPTPNETTTTITVTVFNPVVIPPTPTLDTKRVIQLDMDVRGQVRYALWVPVPLALQAEFAVPGAVSVWTLASVAESAAIAAGEIRELVGVVDRSHMSDLETEGILQARWAEANEDMQRLETWRETERDSYWTGDPWRKD